MCQHRSRLSELLPQELRTLDWVASDGHDLQALGENLNSCLSDYALPHLKGLSTDEAIRDSWLQRWRSEGHCGEGEIDLALYLEAIGPRELQAEFLDYLESLVEVRAEDHPETVRKLREWSSA